MSVGRFLQQAAAGAGGPSDDDFANVVLLLDGDGTSGDNNESFTDSSTNGFTFTESGSVVQGSFSPYGNNWSNYFDGTNDYLNIDIGSTLLGVNSFTIEGWINLGDTDNAHRGVFDLGSGYLNSAVTGPAFAWLVDKWRIYYTQAGSGFTDSSTTSIEPGRWYHFAYVRNSSTNLTKLYIDGTEVISVSDTTSYTNRYLSIGGYYSTGYLWKGNISNFRITESAVYTSNFTPPTSPLSDLSATTLLTAASNSFKDVSGTQSIAVVGAPKVTQFSPFKDSDARDITTDGGSAYFDGNDYLIKTSGFPTIGTGNFTVECWFYSSSVGGSFRCLYDGRENAPDGVGIFQNDASIEVWTDNKVIDVDVITPNQWTHLALVRNSGSMQLYINGSASGSAVSFTTNCTSDERIIGENTVGSGYRFQGYISDLRETHSAVYTSAFTPPTAPLTAITNTELLLNFQDAGIYDRSGINNLDTVGNAQIDTAVKKYGTGSMEFDGSGDYLIIDSSNANYFQINDGDFTAEFWANGTSTGVEVFCGSGTVNNTTATNWWIETVGGVMKIYIASGNTFTIISDTVAFSTYGGWVHVAFVNSSGTSALYMNGTRKATATTPSTNAATCPFWVGGTSSGYVWNGYIDDLRISKGIARYTGASFTPPDAALPKF